MKYFLSAQKWSATLVLFSLLFSLFASNAPKAVHAQSADPAPLFFATDTLSALDTPQAAVRSRVVELNLSALNGSSDGLSSQSAQGSVVQLNLFDDVTYNAVIDTVETNPSGGETWVGHIDGMGMSYVYMVYTEDVFAAHIKT